MEVIVVNDGSTDGTSEVLKKVQAKHPQIKVIEQENRGLSGARNRGMEEATGRYIAFVDGDDQWCPGNLPWKEMQEGEIEIFGLDLLRKDASGKVKPYRSYRPQYDKLFAPAKEFLMGRNLFPCAVSYIVKKELLDRASIRFTTGIYHEDEDYVPRLFLAANGFMAVKGPHYLYIARENSITTGVDHARQQKRIADKLNTIERLQNLGIGQEPLHNEMQQALRCKILFLALDVIRVQLAFGATKDEIKATLHRLKELRLYPFPRYFNLRRVTTSLHYALLCLYLYIQISLKRGVCTPRYQN